MHAHWFPFLVTLRLPCSDSVVSWLHSWKPMILRFTCHPSYPFTHIKHIQTTQKVAIHPPFHRQTGFTSGVCAKSLCSAQADKQASRDRKDGNVTPSAIFSCEELLPMHCDQGAHHKWTTRFKHFARHFQTLSILLPQAEQTLPKRDLNRRALIIEDHVFRTCGSRTWCKAIPWFSHYCSWGRTRHSLSSPFVWKELFDFWFKWFKCKDLQCVCIVNCQRTADPNSRTVRIWIFILPKLYKSGTPSFMWQAHSPKMFGTPGQPCHVQLLKSVYSTRRSRTFLSTLDQCKRTFRKTSRRTRCMQCMSWQASQWFALKMHWDLMIHRL